MAQGQKTGGRVAGTPNKTTVAVKDAMEHVYATLQKDSGKTHGHFTEWAEGNPTEFYKLYAKLLPKEIDANVKGRLVVVIDDSD